MDSSAAKSVTKQDSGTEKPGKSTIIIACSDAEEVVTQGSPLETVIFILFIYALKSKQLSNCLQLMQNVLEQIKLILEIQKDITRRNYSVIKTAEKSTWKKGKRMTLTINNDEY